MGKKKKYTVTIYPVTPWKVTVKAESEKKAIKKALKLDAPPSYVFHGDSGEEWQHDIMEWPNVSPNEIEVEEEQF